MQHQGPAGLHLVIAERHDQAVGVFWTRHPQQQLANISTATALARTQVREAAGAARIVRALRSRFDASVEGHSGREYFFWTTADFEDVVAALAEFDLERGVLIERDSVKLHDPVYIRNLGFGVVTGFTLAGRVMVRLDRAIHAQVGAIAPRSMVKPVMRAAQ